MSANKQSCKLLPIEPIKNEKEELQALPFQASYPRVFLCARSKSGKTTVVRNIIANYMQHIPKLIKGIKFRFYLFVSTIQNDPSWLHIVNELKKHKRVLSVQTETSLFEPCKSKINRISKLDNIMAEMRDNAITTDETDENKNTLPSFINTGVQSAKKLAKSLNPPIYNVLILDDLGCEINRDSAVEQLLKTARHYRCSVLISSQYWSDLSCGSRMQLDNLLLFKGHSLKKLIELHREADLGCSLEDFLKYYQFATKKNFNFLWIDKYNNTYHRNFTDKLVIKSSQD